MSETQSPTTTLLKKGSKKEEKSKEAVKSEVVNQNDVLQVTAHQIENLSKEDALKLADDIFEESGMNDFRLGGVLSVIQTNGWFEGFESFKAMLEAKYGLQYRKAMYLIGIYNDLVINQIPWEKVKNIGWTKLKEISGVLTPDNVDEWVSKAVAMTVLQLQDAVKAYGKAGSGEDATTGYTVTSMVTTLTFKVHTDQKETVRSALDKAKAEVNTEFDTVALESICVAYLGGAINMEKVGGEPSLKEIMGKHTYEEVLQIFEQCYPDVDLTVSA